MGNPQQQRLHHPALSALLTLLAVLTVLALAAPAASADSPEPDPATPTDGATAPEDLPGDTPGEGDEEDDGTAPTPPWSPEAGIPPASGHPRSPSSPAPSSQAPYQGHTAPDGTPSPGGTPSTTPERGDREAQATPGQRTPVPPHTRPTLRATVSDQRGPERAHPRATTPTDTGSTAPAQDMGNAADSRDSSDAVFPLGAGLTSIGVGLAFVAIRLRQGQEEREWRD
ncbi:hypothetical protein [Streptomyces sp. NPDC005438]|uniref:hypothetical protein n=1 Tax=Streptomyces sp. NPDC005438 TaxID=3156880 RepID=UPI0033AA4750